MSKKEYEFSILENDIIKVKPDKKQKGKEYGIFAITQSNVKLLYDIINLMSSSPDITPKFSEKIENYLSPRLNEIMGIISMHKELPDIVNIEISKDNQKEILKGFEFTSVLAKLLSSKVNYQELAQSIKKMKTNKFSPH